MNGRVAFAVFFKNEENFENEYSFFHLEQKMKWQFYRKCFHDNFSEINFKARYPQIYKQFLTVSSFHDQFPRVLTFENTRLE